MKKFSPGVSYQGDLMQWLRDPVTAAEYLNAVLEENDRKLFLKSLRNVIEAQGGMTHFSRKTKINRVSLYKMLSGKGNPGFENIFFILQAAGMKIQAAPNLPKTGPRKAA